VIGPPFISTTTDSGGQFVLDRIGEWFRIEISASSYVSLRYQLTPSDVTTDKETREFQLESLKIASIAIHVRSQSNTRIDASIASGLVLYLGPSTLNEETLGRFAGPKSYDSSKAAYEGDDLVFHCQDVPADVGISAVAALDNFTLASTDIEALSAGEIRVVTLTIPAGITMHFDFVDEQTGKAIPIVVDDRFSAIRLLWHGREPQNTWATTLTGDSITGRIVLPGAGRLHVECALRGYELTSLDAEAQDGGKAIIPLSSLRKLAVRVVTSDGGLLTRDAQSILAFDQSTRTTKFLNGDAPSFRTVFHAAWCRGSESLPESCSVDRSTSLGANAAIPRYAHRKEGDDEMTFDLVVPREPIVVGIFADGQRLKSSIADADIDRLDLSISGVPISTGGLRFRALDAATRTPMSSYSVVIERLINTAVAQRITYQVFGDSDGVFHLEQLMAGTYSLRIPWGPTSLDVWSGSASITTNHVTELDDVEISTPGILDLVVIDDNGAMVPKVSARVYSLEQRQYMPVAYRGQNQSQALILPTGEGHGIRVVSGPIRVEASAAGCEPGFVAIQLGPHAVEACVVALHKAAAVHMDASLRRRLLDTGATRFRLIDEESAFVFSDLPVDDDSPLFLTKGRKLVIVGVGANGRDVFSDSGVVDSECVRTALETDR
jgi:hypothetical protein